MTKIALALGSNLGDRLASLQAAVKALSPYVSVTAVSPVYETAAAYVTDQPAFLNAALIGTTTLEPLALLWMLKDIESEVGRTPTFRFGPRVIDIDIILYGDAVLTTPELTIPHLHMAERDFVLIPLNDIAPDWKHPRNGKTVSELRAALPESSVTNLGRVLS
jgi:2-amino-4-hydroxy-6-hydroxymethyldihydropteridine diphosphokinase